MLLPACKGNSSLYDRKRKPEMRRRSGDGEAVVLKPLRRQTCAHFPFIYFRSSAFLPAVSAWAGMILRKYAKEKSPFRYSG